MAEYHHIGEFSDHVHGNRHGLLASACVGIGSAALGMMSRSASAPTLHSEPVSHAPLPPHVAVPGGASQSTVNRLAGIISSAVPIVAQAAPILGSVAAVGASVAAAGASLYKASQPSP